MTGRRGLTTALLAAAAGGLLIVLAAGQRWASATVAGAAGAPQHVTVSGHEVAAGLAPCGWGVLVLALALVATRGWLRRAVAGGILVAGVIAAVIVMTDVGDVHTALAKQAFAASVRSLPATPTAWPWLALAAAVVATVAGAAAVLRASTWPALGRRYDAPGQSAPAVVDDDAERWAALDRGDDPTT
jgi:uncharacterized membrane protein (TIGR02234 family)